VKPNALFLSIFHSLTNLRCGKAHICHIYIFTAGPRCWNSLPPVIRLADSVDSFKAQLKTHHIFVDSILNEDTIRRSSVSHAASPWCSPLAASPILHRVQALSTRFFYHLMEILPSSCAIAALGLIPPWPRYGYDHLRRPISVCRGWGRTSVIVLSRLPVLDAGTVSLLLFVWLIQWTHSRPSLKLTCSLRLTQFSCLWGALVAEWPRYDAIWIVVIIINYYYYQLSISSLIWMHH